MSFRRNFRGLPRGRGGFRGAYNNNANHDFPGPNNRRTFYSNGFADNTNEDDSSEQFDRLENKQTDGDLFNGYKGQKRVFANTVQSDLHTLKNFTKQFQSGEKKNWPKYIRDLTTFLTSESFPATSAECPQR